MQKSYLKVAAYARVSTDREEQSDSLDNQRAYFERYIGSHEGWSLTDVYYDEGASGTRTDGRRGFSSMIDAALRGEIDLILTKEVSRFARNTVDALFYTRKLKEAGVGVVFTIDNIDTRDSDGELRLTIMACIAQEESRKISERVKWGQKRRMEQGTVFGTDMLGYRVNKGALTVDETEAAVVRAIFYKYTNEEKGVSTIAKELLEEGMLPRTAGSWSVSVLMKILRNEKYAGDLCQKKTITTNFLTHERKYNHGEEEKIYIKDHHEPLISRELWERTQAELSRRSAAKKQNGRHSVCRWCSGRIFCGECGKSFVGRTKSSGGKTVYRAWRCSGFAAHGTAKYDAKGGLTGCDNGSVNEKALISCMKYCIELLLPDRECLKDEIIHEVERCIKDRRSYGTAKNAILRRVKRLQQKKQKAIDLMLDGLIPEDDLRRRIKCFDDEMAVLEKKAEEQKCSDERIYNNEFLKECGEVIGSIADLKDGAETVCHEVLDKIEVYRGQLICIRLRCIPVQIFMNIHTSGRKENFHTEILNVQITKIYGK